MGVMQCSLIKCCFLVIVTPFLLCTHELAAQTFEELWEKNGGSVIQKNFKTKSKPDITPEIDVKHVEIKGAQYRIIGSVNNSRNVTKLIVDKIEQNLSPSGSFIVDGYVPPGGTNVVIYVETGMGLAIERSVTVSRTLLATGQIDFFIMHKV